MEHDKTDKDRQVYQKPTLRVIELAVDEVLAVACKTTFSAPAVNGNGCLTGVCAHRGS